MLPSLKRILRALIFIILLHGRSTVQGSSIECGVRKIARSQMIRYGYNSTIGAWPWHVAMFHKKGQKLTYACGGTLISDRYVLTAAHCVVNPETTFQLPPERIAVRLGIHHLDDLGTQQHHTIENIYQPEDFTSRTLRNDIAILELYSLADLNNYVQPACLGISSSLVGFYGTVVGWGLTENDKPSSVLQSVTMPVIDPVTCLNSNREVFGPTLDETILCAGYTNGTSVCNGDSGGGLFFKVGNAWYLGGIVSYAQQREDGENLCHTRSYGAFTNVAKFLSWIAEVTRLRPFPTPPASAKPTPATPNRQPDSDDCGAGCRDFNCHVDRRCASTTSTRTAVLHPHSNCSKFYKCKERTNIICEFDCPAGLQFNTNKLVCDWPWSAGCDASSG